MRFKLIHLEIQFAEAARENSFKVFIHICNFLYFSLVYINNIILYTYIKKMSTYAFRCEVMIILPMECMKI